jgi:fructuronate reductase
MPVLGRFRLGDTVKKEDILDILQNDSIFGVDLNKYGLADKVVSYLNEELSEAGAVRKTLNKYV